MPGGALGNKTVKQLHDYCRENGIRGYSGLRKADLVDYIGSQDSSWSSSSCYDYQRPYESRTVTQLPQYCRESDSFGYSNRRKTDFNYTAVEDGWSSHCDDYNGTALENKTVAQLHDYCRENGIRRYSGLRKADLIDHITSEESESPSYYKNERPYESRTVSQLPEYSRESDSFGYSNRRKTDFNYTAVGDEWSSICDIYNKTMTRRKAQESLSRSSKALYERDLNDFEVVIGDCGSNWKGIGAGSNIRSAFLHTAQPSGGLISTTSSSSSRGIGSSARETEQSRDKNKVCADACTQTDAHFDTEVHAAATVQVKKLLQGYKEAFLSGEDSDVTIQVEGQQFRAHRVILRARSSVFASMFRHNMKEKATGVVDVEDCDPVTFSDFLHFLYCGSVEKLSGENVFNLYAAADKYDVQDLKSECLAFMKKNLSVETFCDSVELSLRHCESELLKVATDFFAKNMSDVIATVKWQTFIAENPVESNELLIKALASH